MKYRIKINKYGNKQTKIDGYTFDSKNEARRYLELKMLVKAREITNLIVHPTYELQEAFKDTTGAHNRAIYYESDFEYTDLKKKDIVVEDVKGMKTEVYKLKRKLFLYKYPTYRFIES
jgi:hypothetical protein